MSLKFKRNYPLILLLVAVLAFFTFAMGGQRIVAYTVRAKGQQTAQVASTRFDITNDVALFDDSLVHSIQVVMSEEDYDKMITNYQETGLKEYSQVDIIIDGVRINDVGIRLKGNASLRTALGGGMGGGNRPGKAQEMTDRPQGADKAITPGVPADGERPEPPAKAQAPGADLGPAQDGFAQAGGEVKIPFMVKFDEYVDGQTYEGYTAIAVRTYGTSSDAAMLQEPVTNEAARLVGLPATQTA
jgi:spore coat protein CotH